MPRYIDAERVPTDKFWEGMTDKEKAKVLAWFLSAPTADVVKVVRCEDCQYFSITPYGKEIGRGCCDLFYKIVPLDHFCSYGEAKMGGKDEVK